MRLEHENNELFLETCVSGQGWHEISSHGHRPKGHRSHKYLLPQELHAPYSLLPLIQPQWPFIIDKGKPSIVYNLPCLCEITVSHKLTLSSYKLKTKRIKRSMGNLSSSKLRSHVIFAVMNERDDMFSRIILIRGSSFLMCTSTALHSHMKMAPYGEIIESRCKHSNGYGPFASLIYNQFHAVVVGVITVCP